MSLPAAGMSKLWLRITLLRLSFESRFRHEVTQVRRLRNTINFFFFFLIRHDIAGGQIMCALVPKTLSSKPEDAVKHLTCVFKYAI